MACALFLISHSFLAYLPCYDLLESMLTRIILKFLLNCWSYGCVAPAFFREFKFLGNACVAFYANESSGRMVGMQR
jgi:hypothetical protein